MSRLAARATFAVAVLSIVVGSALRMPTSAAIAAGQPGPEATSYPLEDHLSLFAVNDVGGYVPGQAYTLVADNVDQSAAHFQELDGATWNDLDAAAWTLAGQANGVDVYQATYTIASGVAGDHSYRIQLDGQPGFADAVVHVARVTETIEISGPASIQAHHLVTLTAALTAAPLLIAPSGTVEWRNADTNALLETDDLSAGTPTRSFTPSAAATLHITAVYSGDEAYADATSAVFTITVTADTVQASGVTIDYGTFYPVVDGYRDVLHIKGSRLEPISVKVAIYNSLNHVVRSFSLGTGGGAYSIGWNGRTSGGTLLAAGRYKVVQTLTDTAGTKKAYAVFTTISWKKLVTHTTYVTKHGNQVTKAGYGGSGGVYTSTAGYAKLVAGSSGYAIAGWELVLPSATVYKSLVWQVYAKAPLSTSPTYLAAQNFTFCARSSTGPWDESCFDRFKAVGASSLTWFSDTVSASANRSGHYVRGLVHVSYGTDYVYSVRFRVTYAVLQ